MAELARSSSVPNTQNSHSDKEERRNTLPTHTTLAPQASAATMFHRIPHQLVTKTLIAPSPCAFCQKFIWGVLKQAVYCAECKHSWHAECEQFAQNDCGLTSLMLAGALSVSDSSTPSPTPQRSPSLKKEKKTEVQVVNGHVFRIATYHTPTWCKHCSNFIWGFQRQGWKCQKCELDCHSKCVPLVSNDCMFLTGGALSVVENETQDAALAQKAQERRTADKAKKVAFNKKGRFRVKAKNPFSMGFGKSSNFSGPSNDTATSTSTEDSDKKTETSDEEEEEKKRAPLPPLNTEPELINTLERDESFAKTFSAGIHVREKRESLSDSSSVEQVMEEDFAEQAFEDFYIDEDRVLGSGQFGVVKLAKHKASGTPLAVKIIDKKKFWGRKNSTRHLKREIAIMSSIKHPNIIRLHAVIDHPTELYLFMELVEAGDLLAYVEKKGRLNEDEGKFLFHQLCVGVKYLHDSGVIHRDLKPENLLLLEEHGVKRVKLADFGFANIIGEKSFLQSVVGTPAYVAPEILKKTKGYQKSADMWSIGVIMYACLSGVFPFDDEEPVEDQIKAGKFTFPNEYWGKVSDKAIDLICNLLVVEPKNRLSIDDVLKHPWFQIKGQLSI